MAAPWQENNDMIQVLKIECDLYERIGFHGQLGKYKTASQKFRSQPAQAKTCCLCSQEDVSVYLYSKNIRHRLYREDIEFCEKALLHWVRTLFQSHGLQWKTKPKISIPLDAQGVPGPQDIESALKKWENEDLPTTEPDC